jgi:hypothetical protein
MDKDWFPFFSTLFWLLTKVAGMFMFLFGLYALGTVFMLSLGWLGWLWYLVFAVGLPTWIGFVLLKTDLLYDLATSAMASRRRAGPG